jgi:hypothetical protein
MSANDMVVGMKNIADHIEKTIRKSYYLCETGQIPAFKLADQWHLRKSTYAAFLARLEQEAIRHKDSATEATSGNGLAPPRRGRPPRKSA